MPKLVQINAYSGSGSIGRIAGQIGLAAEAAGWDCCMVSGTRYSRPGPLKEIRFDTAWTESLHALYSLLCDAHGRGSFFATLRLIRKIRRLQPDLIHLHNVHGYYLNVRLFFNFLKKSGIPVVWTLHDCWTMTGHCAHFEPAGCLRWQTECYACPLKQAYPKSLFADASRRNFRWKKALFTSLENLHIVTVSQWLAEIVSRSYLKDYPLQVVRNGIDLKVFRPVSSDLRERLDIGERKVILGVSSVWYPEKGMAEFFRLSENPEYRVIMIGVTEAQQKSFPETVVTIRRTHSPEELAAYYTMADVFVNPTYNDSFPTVNLEALACGTPVITYRTGGSPEAVDAATGRVVERGDYEGLLSAIAEVCAQPKPVAACRRAAETKFDMDRCAARYVEIYDACRKRPEEQGCEKE